MNNFTQLAGRRLNRLIIFSLSLFGVLVFNSCKKETAEVMQGTYLGVVNASPSLATYNFYLNDSQANTAALPFGGTMKYRQLSAADYTAKFTSASNVESLFTKKISLTANTIYTLFLISDNNALDGLLVTDDISAINANAYVRFVNLSPDAPALDMAVTGATDKLITNQAFKAASAFTAIAPGTYSFDLKESGSGTVKTTLAGSSLVAGVYYTVISKGLINPTDVQQRFSAQLIANQ